MKIADIVRERDRNCCITCGQPAGECHHVCKRGHLKVCPEINDPMNLVVKCAECHAKSHNQSARYGDMVYLVSIYGLKPYVEAKADYWREIWRRGPDG